MRRGLALLIAHIPLLSGMMAFAETPTANHAIAIIIPAHSTSPGLTREKLALIYKRKILYWDNDTKIQPVNLPISHALRSSFSQLLLGQSPEDMESFWNDMYFHGILPPYVLGSEEAVIRFIAATPGSIGYVDYCSIDPRVTAVLVLSASNRLESTPPDIECHR